MIILNYDAKLGIKSPVQITSTGDKSYQIKVPAYQVIGIELDKDHPYQLYDSSKELLSYSTKDVDTGAMVSQTLSNEKQEKYLDQYKKQMNESAESYYKALFNAVDPDIKLSFVFSN